MDVSMPRMNGIDATRIIHSEFPHIHTIGLSMYDDAETNALKHAFPGNRQGQVDVSLKNDQEGRVVSRVRDNGVGLPEGLDWTKAGSLGLRLVHMLAGQINAEVEVASGAGTEFKVILRRIVSPDNPKEVNRA